MVSCTNCCHVVLFVNGVNCGFSVAMLRFSCIVAAGRYSVPIGYSLPDWGIYICSTWGSVWTVNGPGMYTLDFMERMTESFRGWVILAESITMDPLSNRS